MKRPVQTVIAIVASGLSSLGHAQTDRPVFDLHAMPGFRLLLPYTQQKGEGIDVTVRVCRIPGWAGSTPILVHFGRKRTDATPDQDHDVHLKRMGLRGGENCEAVSTRFDGRYRPDDRFAVCLAYSHRRCQ